MPQSDHTFQRDKSSSALINTDKDGLLLYQEQRKKAKSHALYRAETDEKIAGLQSQLSDIHRMLTQLIGNKEIDVNTDSEH